MKKQTGPTHIVALQTSLKAAEALELELGQLWPGRVVVLAKPQCPTCWIEIYFDDAVSAQIALRALERRRACRGASLRTLKQKSWTTFWRHHFKPLLMGRKLFIRPAWSKAKTPDGRKLIVVDPGLSFGTGGHFTTRFCLERVDALDWKKNKSCADIGTGSAILAIAAAKLGCKKAWGLDHDPVALEHARKNVADNRVGKSVKLAVVDLIETPEKVPRADVIMANIYAQILIQLAPAITSKARKCIILSGIREFELDAVASAYQHHGWFETMRDGDGEWGGLVLQQEKFS